MSRVFIVDPGLRKRGGHNYQMARGVAAGMRARGMDVVILAHVSADADLRAQLGLKPVFSQLHYELLSNDPISGVLEDFLAGTTRFARELEESGELPIADTDLFFLPTAAPREMWGLARYLKERKARPRVAALFHRTEPPGTSLDAGSVTSAILRYSVKMLAGAVTQRRMVLAATNEFLAAKLTVPAGRRFLSWPAPVWYPPPCGHTPPPDPDVPVIAFVGHMRGNHGFDAVPALARDLRRRWPRATIRIHVGSVDQRLDLSAYRELTAEGIAEVIEGWVDDRAMARLYCSATVLVMPYDRSAYREMVSAVMSTAIALGKPCVVPSDSWLSRQIEVGRASGAVYVGDDVGAITDAVARVLGDMMMYTNTAAERVNDWRRSQSGEALVDRLHAWYRRNVTGARAMSG